MNFTRLPTPSRVPATVLAVVLFALGGGTARADSGKLNLHLDPAFAMPTASYLAPPGNNDGTGHIGFAVSASLDYVVAGPFALELILGGGMQFDIVNRNVGAARLSGFGTFHGGVGGRLRFLDNDSGNLWINAHLGVCRFDGWQFCGDGGVGYEFSISDSVGIGPFARFTMMSGGHSSPFNTDTHFTSAIQIGASVAFRLVARDGAATAQPEVDLDQDDDGILDSNDACITEPEDFDNHNDEDGCPETETDIDGDGIQNEVDQCPEVPEDRDQFQDVDGCPDPDNDADRVLDTDDRCPMDPEDLDNWEDQDGCPDPDNDGDGVVDTQDNCVNEAGVIENRGCPDRDRDGDTVVDRVDNCPDEPGTVENHGCREQQLVEIREGQLFILEKIYFRTNSHVIDRRSFPLLDQVAAVINAHPEINMIEVGGHTDSRGSDARNLALSQRRVNSVVTYLVRKGVARTRLRAVGYGETRPITPNATTEEEHESNRRVEFVIIN